MTAHVSPPLSGSPIEREPEHTQATYRSMGLENRQAYLVEFHII